MNVYFVNFVLVQGFALQIQLYLNPLEFSFGQVKVIYLHTYSQNSAISMQLNHLSNQLDKTAIKSQITIEALSFDILFK